MSIKAVRPQADSLPRPHWPRRTNRARHDNAVKSLCQSWYGRAAVKKADPSLSVPFEEGKPDFLEELLPFRDHPDYLAAPPELKTRVLACGWVAYNEKVVKIESSIVSPVCEDILNGEFPWATCETSRQAAAQTLVDESYHILLVLDANRVTRERRGLLGLKLPQFQVVRCMREMQDHHAEEWKKRIVQLLCAIATETSISDYLRLLASAEEIQPLNRITTNVHWKDEAAHCGLFKSLGHLICAGFSAEQRDFLASITPLPWLWFADRELEVWRSMLLQIGFPNAEGMVADCAAAGSKAKPAQVLRDVRALMEDLGVGPLQFTPERPPGSRGGQARLPG